MIKSREGANAIATRRVGTLSRGQGKAGRKWTGFPSSPWFITVLFYIALFSLYRFLLHGYLDKILERQTIGLKDTLGITAVIVSYVLACAVPPFLWGRRSYYHPLWRGVECYICYAAISLLLGAVFAATNKGSWSVWSGLTVGGVAWMRVLAALAFSGVFVAASRWGAATSAARRQRRGGSKRAR